MRRATMMRALAAAGLAPAQNTQPDEKLYENAPGISIDVKWQDLDWDQWRADRDEKALQSLRKRATRPRDEPRIWTHEIVGRRLVDALRTLRRLPARTGPAGYGSTMPEILRDWADKLAQLENPDNSRIGVRVTRSVTSAELARMEEALSWPLRYLADDPLAGRLVWAWAAQRARGTRPGERGDSVSESLEAAYREYSSSPLAPGADQISPADRKAILDALDREAWGSIRARLQRRRVHGLKVCADGLNAAGVAVW